jgi:hypothetical protein
MQIADLSIKNTYVKIATKKKIFIGVKVHERVYNKKKQLSSFNMFFMSAKEKQKAAVYCYYYVF